MTGDVAIIGGGLAGLALSIDLRRRGYGVVVIEKGDYPRHKVCGEYISMESRAYLQQLCPNLQTLDLPHIRHFQLTTGRRQTFTTPLTLGGFGISRYLLEDLLYLEAKNIGVIFLLHTKALAIDFDEQTERYTIKTNSEFLNVGLVCNAAGRKSNFEAREKAVAGEGINYIGVKYHIRLSRNPGLIEIHNFPGGYCGISNIEEGKACLCYIVNSKFLRAAGNSITELERKTLFQNGRLEKIFTDAEFVFKEPLTISGINFRIKKPVDENTFFLGDAAGSIAPITGNGMSMGLRSAHALAKGIDAYLLDKTDRQQLVSSYGAFWHKEFAGRVRLSRHFQKLSEYPLLTGMTIGLFNAFPPLAKTIIRQTHGLPF